jgi:two-component system sensor histidine kinase DesK
VVTIAGIASAVAVTGFLLNQPLMWWVPGLVLIVMTGFGTISRETLYDRNRALLGAQEEVRRLAGTAERERIARDLHDVVGRTLTLVALKADLAEKLVTRDQAASVAEMRSIAAAAREGLAEVRDALAGVSAGSLGREAAASRDALAAAGVEVTVRGDPEAIDADAGAVLAMTLREAVTNVIRHARATRCLVEINVEAAIARLSVIDNGGGGSFTEGQGLAGMRQRLRAAGGSLKVNPAEPGTRLVATVPLAT